MQKVSNEKYKNKLKLENQKSMKTSLRLSLRVITEQRALRTNVYYNTKINSKAFAIPILTASGLY